MKLLSGHRQVGCGLVADLIGRSKRPGCRDCAGLVVTCQLLDHLEGNRPTARFSDRGQASELGIRARRAIAERANPFRNFVDGQSQFAVLRFKLRLTPT